MEERIKKVMANVFNEDIININENSTIDNIEKWDSIGHMNLIVALEEEFDTVFDDEDIEILVNYKNILKVLENI